MEVAINTIGGRLVLLRPTGPRGHWLDVRLVALRARGRRHRRAAGGDASSREVQAGSSYLSSEDPRVHFGLGSATRVATLTVRFPGGATTTLHDVRADRIVTVARPPPRTASDHRSRATCTATQPARPLASRALLERRDRGGRCSRSAARRAGAGARPLRPRAMADAYARAHANAAGATAISYAAYRLLVWRASFGANLPRSFALLDAQLRALCSRPAHERSRDRQPRSEPDRAAAIAAGRHDGSLESLHYADPSFTPRERAAHRLARRLDRARRNVLAAARAR